MPGGMSEPAANWLWTYFAVQPGLSAPEAVPKRLPHCGGAGTKLLVQGVAHRLAGVSAACMGGVIGAAVRLEIAVGNFRAR